jgi:hypothetical protein
MAKYGSQGIFKERSMQAVRDASIVCHGVQLPDIYCCMILAGKMRFREAIRAFKCEEQGTNEPVH